ncbi:MAG: PqqD family protein [Oscillospiraceae bacterium]|nr:PqqD family protein [Oscillospiraceae bacterium]
MKLKYDFAVREIVGEYVMVPLGQGALEFSGMISTSETGALLVEALKQDVSREDLIHRILEEYDVDLQTANTDLDEFLNQLRKLNILIED